MSLHIENAKPGHLALVSRLEAAVDAMTERTLREDEGHRFTDEDKARDRAELEDARGDLLALLRAQEEALESAAEREKGRALALRLLSDALTMGDSLAAWCCSLDGTRTFDAVRCYNETRDEIRAALKAHP